MSLIDDSHIEAYLDGAYDAISADQRAEIERRLEEDEAFAARVGEARRAREEASSILAVAAPSRISPPSFQELQERAAASGAEDGKKGGGWTGLPPLVGLGWAATVVLALGVGWYVGQDAGAGPMPAASMPRAPLEVEAGESVVVAEEEKATASTDLDAADLRMDRARDEAAAAPTVAGNEDPAELQKKQEVDESFARDVEGRVPEPPARRQAEQTVAQDTVAQEASAGGRAEARVRSTPADPSFRDEAPAAEAPAAAAREAGVLADSDEHALHSLALPGLEVLAVSLADEGALSGLEILHRLPTGDTLSLRYVGLFSEAGEPLGMAAEEWAEDEALPSVTAQLQSAALPPGWHQEVVRKEGRWLVARARLSVAEIRAYLMTLK